MSNVDPEGWSRVKGRLRAEVGDDVYSSWFARMDLEAIEDGTVRLSVPTRFLKSWIQSHYAERVLACWQAEQAQVGRIELIVRSAVLRSAIVKPKAETEMAVGDGGRFNVTGNGRALPVGDATGHEALGGSPDIVVECIGASGFLAKAVQHVASMGQVLSMGFCTTPDALIPAIAASKGVTMRFPVGYALSDFERVARDLDRGHADPKMMISSVVSLEDVPATFDRLRGPNAETKVQIGL